MLKSYSLIFYIVLLCLAFSKDKNDIYKSIQTQLILNNQNDVIILPEGKFNISRSLWAENLNDVVIEGKGIDKTILNFDLLILLLYEDSIFQNS